MKNIPLIKNDPMDIDELQSKTIDWLRFPLAIGILFIHNRGTEIINTTNDLTINVFLFLRNLLSSVLAELSVPAFFFISGYLFFYNIERWSFHTYINKLKKRIKTLLIPYFLWNIIALIGCFIFAFSYTYKKKDALEILINKLFHTGLFSVLWNWDASQTGKDLIGRTIYLESPLDSPLWFIRDLIIISILSPFTFILIKRTKGLILIVLGLAYITRIWINLPGLSINSVFFFYAGSYFSINKKILIIEFSKIRKLSFILTFILLTLLLLFWNSTYRLSILSLFVIIGLISTINCVIILIRDFNWNINQSLVKSSYFIFASHMILILPLVNILFKHMFTSTTGISLLAQYLIGTIAVLCICLILYSSLKKWTPRVLSLITGNK